ncbi:MAG: acetylornithine/N-succinyldiaminopimelate aminotransferase [Rhodospirillaceae bacterium]|nr:MAG: acetylornithine/N-succinyldiaminopimelate aminotransferase [Rhodospirillaceae bacterium]
MNSAVMPTYTRSDLAFVRGEGAYLYDAEGQHYLDFCSGVAVNALGHAHPHLVHVLKEQAEKLWHCSNLYRIPEQERLAERLVAASFADTAFFCNSGAEAVECALKMARKYHDAVGQPERYRVVVMNNAFHGRTLATVSAGGQEKHTKGFEPLVEGFDRVPFGDLDAARAVIGPQTAAILVEPVQGEGGVRVAPSGYLPGLRALADAHGLLLIFDEVQTGLCRTGCLFAHEWFDVVPDIMALAKGLGGGFPVGCCLATARAAQGMTAGTHASTFGGNPLAMAVGNATLDVLLAEGFLRAIHHTSRLLHAALEEVIHLYPTVLAEVRGLGLLFGLRCIVPNTTFVTALQKAGLLTVAAGDNVVRLLPPLVIGENEIEEALDILDRTCQQLARGHDGVA